MRDDHHHHDDATHGPGAPSETEPGSAGSARARRRGSRRRRVRTSAAVVAAFVAGSILSGAGAVWAGHQFSDVPSGHPFHGDIDWMVDHGITEGYEDGTFRPTAPVSRQAASAFLHRYNGELEVVTRTYAPTSASPEYSRVVVITCPAGKRGIAASGRSSTAAFVLGGSGPLGADATTWQLVFYPREGSTAVTPTFYGWVLCRPI